VRALAAAAVRAAMADAGVGPDQVDGLLLNPSALADPGVLPPKVQDDMGLRTLGMLTTIEAKGSSVLQMVQYATAAIHSGLASVVACVFADAPIGRRAAAGSPSATKAR